MEKHFGSEAIAAVVFLSLYAAVFLWMSFAWATSRIHLKSRWGLLYFHGAYIPSVNTCADASKSLTFPFSRAVIVRMASQSCGVPFGVDGFSNTSLFIACELVRVFVYPVQDLRL